ncbi:hypothetical protein BBJ28_00009039 [Nothophytophthora sp. Chile5]|nr:hypothetical protein BBJ28_00009039 [Nothophytophthora sp. Chile5]
MRLPSPPASASRLRVALLTDVEGNWQYVRNVARQSSCFQLVTRPRTDGSGDDEMLELRDDCMLVFGGDGGDKGDETLRYVPSLLFLATGSV